MPAWQVGVVLGATVAGTALMSMLVARYADRVGRRRWYAGLYVLLGVVGVVFAFAGSVWLLALAALTGVLSTEVIESGPFTSLEQPMLASDLRDRAQVHGFGVYNAIAAAAGSLGALAAGRPATWSTRAVLARWFLVLVPVAVIGWALARRLSGDVEPIAADVVTGSPVAVSVDGVSAGVVVRPRLVRRWVHGVGVRRLLAAGPVRRLTGGDRGDVLRHRAVADGVVPGRSPAGRPVRAAAHDGVHPPAVQRVARRRGVRPQPGHGDRAVVGPHGAVADGRPDPAGLRDGPGRPRRAHPRRRVHQHRPLRQPSGRPAAGGAGPDGRARRCRS